MNLVTNPRGPRHGSGCHPGDPAILVLAWYFVYDHQVRVDLGRGSVIGLGIYGWRRFMSRNEPGSPS